MIQFRLRTLMLVFVILWSSLAAFEGDGIVVTIGIVSVALMIHALAQANGEGMVGHHFHNTGARRPACFPPYKPVARSSAGWCRHNLHNLGARIARLPQSVRLFPAGTRCR